MGIKEKLFDIRAKVGKLTKDTSNPFYKSKYADINQLIEMTDPLFSEQKVLILMPIRKGCLVIELTDLESGEVMESEIELPQSPDPQKVGSAITYYRRYGLKSLLNIQEEDDDGNKGAGKSEQSENQPTDPPDERPWMTEDQFQNYLSLIKKGEKWIHKLNKKLRMKKVYKQTLESAEKNYKPQP